MTIVDGQQIAQDVIERLRGDVENILAGGKTISLGVVLVGHDKPSQTYVGRKKIMSEKLGLDFKLFTYPATISEDDLIIELQNIQGENDLSGLIVQLPLPDHINAKDVINQIDPEIDVDCLTFFNLGKVVMGTAKIFPPTPAACLEILRYHNVDLTGKHLVIVGRGELVGKPLAAMLGNAPATVTVCNRSTPDLSVYTKTADIIVTGVGKHDLITADMIKPGAVIIDAGVDFVNDKMTGDVSFDDVAKTAGLVTPVPGGVGPITVAKLIENTVALAKEKFL